MPPLLRVRSSRVSAAQGAPGPGLRPVWGNRDPVTAGPQQGPCPTRTPSEGEDMELHGGGDLFSLGGLTPVLTLLRRGSRAGWVWGEGGGQSSPAAFRSHAGDPLPSLTPYAPSPAPAPPPAPPPLSCGVPVWLLTGARPCDGGAGRGGGCLLFIPFIKTQQIPPTISIINMSFNA